MKEKSWPPNECQIVLAKTRDSIAVQKVFFNDLQGVALKFIQEEMTKIDSQPAVTPLQKRATPRDSLDLKARLVHLAESGHGSEVILESIFGSESKEAQRGALDDKSQRTINKWAQLAENFFNDPDWQPENTQSDSRLTSIDPSKSPEVPWTAEELRYAFTKIRTEYTNCYNNFHLSGNLEAGEGDGADIFYDRFSKGSLASFYMHMLFKDEASRYCTRNLSEEQQSDVGAKSKAQSSLSSSKKRSKNEGIDLTKEDIRELFKQPESQCCCKSKHRENRSS